LTTTQIISVAREAGLFALLIAATFTDIAYGKIYNWLVYPGIVVGVGLAVLGQCAGAHQPGAAQSLLGLGLGAGLFGLFFSRGWMGAADVKLAAAIGALKGLHFFVWALIYITLAGFILAIVLLIWEGRFAESMKNTIVFFFRPRKLKENMDASGAKPVYIPYGLAMAVGTMCAWFIERFAVYG
jgi:prepilin peptidase CpaA